MTIEIDISQPSGPLKRDIIELAFGDLGMAAYEFGRTPEEVADALRRLDTTMAELEDDGILLGYAFPTNGVSSGEESSGIPKSALNAVAGYLALRLAPLMGATISINAQANAVRAMARLRSQYATMPSQYFAGGTPRGAGNRGAFFTPYLRRVFPCLNTSTTTTPVPTVPPSNPGVALPANLSLPIITGSAQVGQLLSCSTGSWSG